MCRVATNVTELNTFLDVMKSRDPNLELTRENISEGLTAFIAGFLETSEGNSDVEKYASVGKKILKDEKEYQADLFNTKLKFFTTVRNFAISRYGEETVNLALKGR